jgi:hypothetical protein
MTDPGEVLLSKLAKKVLSAPPKKREDSKLGKPRVNPNKSPAPNAQTTTPANEAGFSLRKKRVHELD